MHLFDDDDEYPYRVVVGLESLELDRGTLYWVERPRGTASIVSLDTTDTPIAFALEGPTRAESVHIDGARVRVVGDDEVVLADLGSRVTLARTPLEGLTPQRLRTARIDGDLVICDGDRTLWIAPDASVIEEAGWCGSAISDRTGIVLRGPSELGRIGRGGEYTAFSIALPATDDVHARVVNLGDIAIRASVETTGDRTFVVLVRVTPSGAASTTIRRLVPGVGPVQLADDASGDQMATFQLDEIEVFADDPDLDADVPDGEARPDAFTASRMFRVE